MSTRSTSSKSKTTSKTKAKTATKPKSRLDGPKPPKARAAKDGAKPVSKPATVHAATTAAAPAKRPGKTPERDIAERPAVPAATPSSPAAPAELKKRELLEQVVARSDIKKKYAKPVVEAMLEILGESIAKGRELNLSPMGKIKYNRTKETTTARVVVSKIRQNKPVDSRPVAVQDKLADAAE